MQTVTERAHVESSQAAAWGAEHADAVAGTLATGQSLGDMISRYEPSLQSSLLAFVAFDWRANSCDAIGPVDQHADESDQSTSSATTAVDAEIVPKYANATSPSGTGAADTMLWHVQYPRRGCYDILAREPSNL